MQVCGWGTVHIPQYIMSRASLEAFGCCHLAFICAVLCCNAQVSTVVVNCWETILVQDVKIGHLIFGPYCAQIDDGFFKISRDWIWVWQRKDQQFNKLWWLADGGINYFKCMYDLKLEAQQTTCSKMKRQKIVIGENKVTVGPSPCCLRGGGMLTCWIGRPFILGQFRMVVATFKLDHMLSQSCGYL